MPPAEDTPDTPSDPLDELVAECLRRHSLDGAMPLEELCARHPQHAEALRQRLHHLERLGLGGGPVAPEQVGPYRILDVLGEGGMGTVYLAEQKEPIRRRVALKLIKLGMDTKDVVARFEVERQALAMMNHPNIAKVFDAGATPEGRPYFVMEYVPGESITQYCDRQKLGMQARLGLFTQVCRAVQHAHQNGVMHRDIKPSNILVQMQDVTPTAKIIDFGIAKATNQHLTERTLFTERGRIIGTPEYMSPEQAEMTGLNVDTRTDVYSLGVLLYELMTGALPFDSQALRRAGYLEIQRVIREQEPPRPSTRVSTSVGAPDLAARRLLAGAGDLVRALRGDLDWITMKALEKDPARRYQTASELAMDVERHLRHEPVAAGPPSFLYLATKLMRRHRGPVLASLGVVVALAVGLLVSVNLYLAADVAQAEARRQAIAATASAEQARAAKEESDTLRLAKERALVASEAARELSEGNRLLAHSMVALPADPALAVLLAIEGARRAPGLQANNQLLAALREHRERAALRLEDRSPAGPEGDRRAAFAFDAVGGRVATVCGQDALRVWSTVDGKLLRAVPLAGDALGVAFSLDGRHVVVALQSHALVFDTTTWARLALLSRPTEFGRGHSHLLTASAGFDRTGGLVVASFGTSALCVWDWQTRSEPSVLSAHDGYIHGFAIHPASGLVATASRDHTARVWDLATASQRACLSGHSLDVRCVAFSPDGTKLLTGSGDGTARLAEIRTGRTIAVLPAGRDVQAVAFDPAGRRFVTGGWDGVVRVWDAETGAPVASQDLRCGWILDATFAADGREFVVGTLSGTVVLCATETASVVSHLRGHKERVTQVAFGPDGRSIGSASWDGTVRLWERSTQFRRLLPHEAGLRQVSLPHAESGLVVTVTDGRLDRAAEVIEASTGAVLTRVEMAEPLNAVACSPDGTLLVTTQDESEAGVWKMSTGERVGLLGVHGAEVLDASFSAQGDRVLTSTTSGEVHVFDVASAQELASEPFREWVFQARFDPSGDRVAVACDDGCAYVWSWRGNSAPVRLTGHLATVVGACFDPSGSRVLTASRDGTARVWNAETGKEVLRITAGSGPVLAAVFSVDGSVVATGGEDGVVRLWNAADGVKQQELVGHAGPVFSLRHLDGTHLLSAADDGSAKLWRIDAREVVSTHAVPRGRVFSSWGDRAGLRLARLSGPRTDLVAQVRRVGSGEVVAHLAGHADTVLAAAFSPDGALLATGGEDRTVRVWRSATGECLHAFEGHGSHVDSVQFDRAGGRVLSHGRGTVFEGATERGQVFLWDLHTASRVWRLRELDEASFSRDGSRIVACNLQGFLLDAATGGTMQKYGPEYGPGRYVDGIALSPDGQWVVTTPRTGSPLVWDAASGTKVAELATDRRSAWTFPSFDPAGAHLLVRGSSPNTWRVFECAGFRETLTIPSLPSLARGGFDDEGRSIAIYDGHGSVLRVPLDMLSAAMAAKSRDLTVEEARHYGVPDPVGQPGALGR